MRFRIRILKTNFEVSDHPPLFDFEKEGKADRREVAREIARALLGENATDAKDVKIEELYRTFLWIFPVPTNIFNFAYMDRTGFLEIYPMTFDDKDPERPWSAQN